METTVQAIALAVFLFFLMLACIEAGRRWARSKDKTAAGMEEGLEAVQASVFGLLGLLLAFTFGGGEQRIEARRAEIVREGNAIGTAYLWLDMLKEPDRKALRELFRHYVDARQRAYEDVSDRGTTDAALAEASALLARISVEVNAACEKLDKSPTTVLLLPAVSAVTDVAAQRTEALDALTPWPIVLLLVVLAPLSALFVGFGMPSKARRLPFYSILYALIVAVTTYVVLDLDHPRYGLIRLKDTQARVFRQLREDMGRLPD